MATTSFTNAVGFVSNLLSTAADVAHIGDVPTLTSTIPIRVLLLGHCLAIAGMTRGRYPGSQLLSFVQGFLMAFGGGIASSLFLGNPTANVLFQNNDAVILWTVSWWVVNHNPLDLVAKLMDLAPVGIAARSCLQILRAGIIAAQVDAAAKAFPGVIAPAVIAGTLAGAGGKITTDAVASLTGLRVSFEVATPTYALRSSLIGAMAHYLLVHVLGALSSAQGEGLLVLVFLAHTLADDVLGTTYDYTVPIIDIFATCTLINAPKASSHGRRGRSTQPAATAAATAVPATPRSASRARTPRRKKSVAE